MIGCLENSPKYRIEYLCRMVEKNYENMNLIDEVIRRKSASAAEFLVVECEFLQSDKRHEALQSLALQCN